MVRVSLPSTASAWAIIGAVIGLGFGLFVTTILTGEIAVDPGGWWAVLIIVAMLGPIGVLTAAVLVRPAVGEVIVTVLGALYVVGSFAALVAADAVTEFEDSHGPVMLVVGLMVWIPSSALGLFRPLRAGLVLLLTILVPALVDATAVLILGRSAVVVTFVVLLVPFVVAGVLFLVDGLRTRHRDGAVTTHG